MAYFCWDVSTSVIGVCMLDQLGQPFRFDFLTPGDLDTMAEKYVYVSRVIPALIDSWCADLGVDPGSCHHFIEDRLGNFTKGATTLQTLMKLAAMNAAVSQCIMVHGVPDPCRVSHIHPATAKKWAGLKVPKGGDKKAHAIMFARQYSARFPYEETKNGNPKKGVEDMADALVTGIAGLRMRSAGALETGKAEAPAKVARGAKDRKKRKG